jgi:hypothetical protein
MRSACPFGANSGSSYARQEAIHGGVTARAANSKRASYIQRLVESYLDQSQSIGRRLRLSGTRFSGMNFVLARDRAFRDRKLAGACCSRRRDDSGVTRDALFRLVGGVPAKGQNAPRGFLRARLSQNRLIDAAPRAIRAPITAVLAAKRETLRIADMF